MAFHFVLKPVLRLRQSLEDRERLRLAFVLGCLAKVDQQCQSIDLERRQILNGASDRLQSGMTGAELQLEYTCAAALERSKSALMLQKSRLEQEKAAQERALEAAQRKRKTVEHMRERQFELYRRGQERIEQRRADELHSARGTNRS